MVRQNNMHCCLQTTVNKDKIRHQTFWASKMFSLVADCRDRGCTDSERLNANIWLTLGPQRKRSQPHPLSTPRHYLQSTSGVNIFVYQWKSSECRQGRGNKMGKRLEEGYSQGEGETEGERGNVGSTSMVCQLKILANPLFVDLFLFSNQSIGMAFHPWKMFSIT